VPWFPAPETSRSWDCRLRLSLHSDILQGFVIDIASMDG
jgi:hypothetical protein